MGALRSRRCWPLLLLAGMLAVSATISASSITPPSSSTASTTTTDTPLLCQGLNASKDLLPQMEVCDGQFYSFAQPVPSPPVFDLTNLTQDKVYLIIYDRDNGVIDQDKLRTFMGNVIMKNSSIEEIKLAMAALVGGSAQEAIIIGNNQLHTLLFTSQRGAKVNLTVKGNKQLSRISLRNLDQIDGVDWSVSKIQGYRECFFDGKPLASLSDLKGCETVEGDMIIDPNTRIPADLSRINIKNIIGKGCLQIENPHITNLDFIKELQNVNASTCSSGQGFIRNNPNLCLTSEERLKWNDANYNLQNDVNCTDKCTPSFAESHQMESCEIIVGDVVISGTADINQLAHWDRVQKIEGSLEVDGTDLTDIEIFKNLTEIDNPSRVKPSISVTRNMKMAKFNLPSLTTTSSLANAYAEPMLVVGNDPNFQFSLAEGDRWHRIMNHSALPIPVETPPETTTTPSSTTLSQELFEEKEKEIIAKNRETKKSETATLIGVVLATIIGLILLFCGCTLVVYCYLKKKKGKDDDAKVEKVAPPPLATRIEKKKTMIKEKKKVEKMKRRVEMVDKAVKVMKKRKAGRKQNKPGEQLPSEDSSSSSDSMTIDQVPVGRQLNKDEKYVLNELYTYLEEQFDAKKIQMVLDSIELAFKSSEYQVNVDSPLLDFEKAKDIMRPVMKSKNFYPLKGPSYALFYNPRHVKCESIDYIYTYDPDLILKHLLTNVGDFFVMNAHLLPELVEDLSQMPCGPSLVEMEGPVTIMSDVHSAQDVFQLILSLDLLDAGKTNGIHPALCQKFLILGDMLDRGPHGYEVYFTACLLARKFPGLFVVLRGNHEQIVGSSTAKESTVNIYAEKLATCKEIQSIECRYHFAEVMNWEILTKITPRLPYACLINGKIFAAHGGISNQLTNCKGTLHQIFTKCKLPFIEESKIIPSAYRRWNALKKGEMFKKESVRVFDMYVDKFESIRDEVRKYMNGTENIQGYDDYYKYKANNPNHPPNPLYELKHPELFDSLWSDPTIALASDGNSRGSGCSYTDEDVRKFNKRFGTEAVVRGHQAKSFVVSDTGNLLTVYSNPYHVASIGYFGVPHEFPKCAIRYKHVAHVLHINPDGTCSFVFIGLTHEKKKDQEKIYLTARIKRELGKYGDAIEKKLEEKMKQEEEAEEKAKPAVVPVPKVDSMEKPLKTAEAADYDVNATQEDGGATQDGDQPKTVEKTQYSEMNEVKEEGNPAAPRKRESVGKKGEVKSLEK